MTKTEKEKIDLAIDRVVVRFGHTKYAYSTALELFEDLGYQLQYCRKHIEELGDYVNLLGDLRKEKV